MKTTPLTINFRLTPEQIKALDRLSYDDARSRNLQVKHIVLEYLKKSNKITK